MNKSDLKLDSIQGLFRILGQPVSEKAVTIGHPGTGKLCTRGSSHPNPLCPRRLPAESNKPPLAWNRWFRCYSNNIQTRKDAESWKAQFSPSFFCPWHAASYSAVRPVIGAQHKHKQSKGRGICWINAFMVCFNSWSSITYAHNWLTISRVYRLKSTMRISHDIPVHSWI